MKKSFDLDGYFQRRKQLATEARPYLIPFLVKLGVTETKARTFTVGKAYDVLYRRLRKALGKQPDSRVTVHYWLWTVGIPLDHLKTISRKEASQMWSLIGPNVLKQREAK